MITHVAIKYLGKIFSLPSPNRHHNVIRMIAEETGEGIKDFHKEGFVTSNGMYLSRREAFIYAKNKNQLNRDPNGYSGDELFSEDIW